MDIPSISVTCGRTGLSSVDSVSSLKRSGVSTWGSVKTQPRHLMSSYSKTLHIDYVTVYIYIQNWIRYNISIYYVALFHVYMTIYNICIWVLIYMSVVNVRTCIQINDTCDTSIYACNTYSWYQKLCWESTVSRMKLESFGWAIVVFWCFWQVLTLYVSRKKILMDADRFTTTSSTTSREHATCDSMIGTVCLRSNIMIRHACMQNVLKLDHTASYCVYMGKNNHKTDGQKQSQNWCNVSIHRSWHVEEEHLSFSKAYYVHVFAKVYTDVRPLSCPVTSRTKKHLFCNPTLS